MGLITYRMVVQRFKRKLRPLISEHNGFLMLIKKEISLFLDDEHVRLNFCYNSMLIGFAKPAAFNRMLKKRCSPLKMNLLKAAKLPEVQIVKLREKILDTFLACIAEAWEGNREYRLPLKKTKK